MNFDRSTIEAAKARLPLPDLLRALGFNPPTDPAGGNMSSPFGSKGRQKTPSFSIFLRENSWGWCDRTGGDERKGDEITFLECLEGLSRADAIARYVALAGVEKPRSGQPAKKAGCTTPPVVNVKRAEAAFDWDHCLKKFTPRHAAHLAKWRKLPAAFFIWLNQGGHLGIVGESCPAFAVRDRGGKVASAHVRTEKGQWIFTPKGGGCSPLVLGDLDSATNCLIAESQWDLFCAMAAMDWHTSPPAGWAAVATRGASNGRFAAACKGKVIALPQNDTAGAKWLAAVAAAAAGEVFAADPPLTAKDWNDALRADGSLDLAAAIHSARAVAKPIGSAETGEAKALAPATTPPFDPFPLLDKMGLYWLNGSASYFLRREDAERSRFLEMGSAEIRRKLRVRGVRTKPNHEAGEFISQIDAVLDAATETRAVDFAISLAGMPAGVYEMPGGRVLVRESPRIIEPKEGRCDTISELLLGLLGTTQTDYFAAWLKIAYEALRAGERRPGQALIITGPPDCGKSRLQHQIIAPILAGRIADPKAYFFGRTDFNSELIGAENLLIEEIPSSTKHDDRMFFGERIKEIVVNDTARLHGKGKDAVTVTPFWRLSITLNDNPEKLRCLPPLTDDVAEKIILLQAKAAPEFWARFDSAADPRKAFRDAIAAELPAFAHRLVNLKIHDRLQGRRYGVRSHIPEELAQTLFESEPEFHLMLLIDKHLFSASDDEENPQPLEPWQGDAEDLKNALTSDSSAVRASAVRLLNAYPTACGQYLSRLAAKYPARIQKHRTATSRNWIIQPPQG